MAFKKNPIQSIIDEISRQTGKEFNMARSQHIGGGDINKALMLVCYDKSRWFLKYNHKNKFDMFAAEARGLAELRKTEAIKVPEPICAGVTNTASFLLLEALDLSGTADTGLLGEQLARLHLFHNKNFQDKNLQQKQFGWTINNTIGSTPQMNTLEDDWVLFYKKHRLNFQLELAMKNGAPTSLLDKSDQLISNLDIFFTGYQPVASILHGDLWSGNWGGDKQGNPVIYDPAVYFGDHEADLAMMQLFGNPGERFFAAYQSIFPIDPGYTVRKTLYNLYHIINHYNLFSGGYAIQAERMIDQLLAETRG